MVQFVDWYIKDGYRKRMNCIHRVEEKKALFASKFLDFSDIITGNDRETVDTAREALQQVDIANHDPTIYWVTAPKVLGYWADKGGHTCFVDLLGTQYQYAEDAYGRC